MYQLQKAEHIDRQGRLPYCTDGRLFGLAKWITHISSLRRQLWVLENWNRRPGQGQNDIFITSWTAGIFLNVV